MRPRVRNAPALVVVLVASALLLAACGSSSSSSGGGSADAILQRAFAGGKTIKSGKLALDVGLDLKGVQSLGGPLKLKLSGPFEGGAGGAIPKLDMTLDLDLAGKRFTAGLISTGSQGFVSFQGTDYVVPDQAFASFKQGYAEAQRKSKAQQGKTTLASLGIDPRGWLKDPKVAGSADVGGTDTDHVSADVDVGKLVDDIGNLARRAGSLTGTTQGQGISAKTRQQITDAVKRASVDVYVGKADGILRKLSVGLSFEVPQSLRSSAQGLQGGDLSLSLELDDVNQAQRIEAPSNARPITELGSQLQSLLGGLGGLGAGSGSSGSSGSSGGSSSGDAAAKRLENFTACVKQAGSDSAKAQDCAKLLNP